MTPSSTHERFDSGSEHQIDELNLARGLVATLAQTLCLPDLALDAAHHHCVLVFDLDLVVNLEFKRADSRLILSCQLDELPANAEPLTRELLAANLYWQRTRGSTLAVDEATNQVFLTYPVSVIETNAAGFEVIVEDFVNQAEYWRERIREAGQQSTVTNNSPVSPADPNAGYV